MTVEEVTKLKLEEGEALLVRLPRDADHRLFDMCHKALKSAFPNNPILLFDEELEFKVVKV
jgi:hypothetical protein